MEKKLTLRSPVGAAPLEFEWPLAEEDIQWIFEVIQHAGKEFPKLENDLNALLSDKSSRIFANVKLVRKLFKQFNKIITKSKVVQESRRLKRQRAAKESLKDIIDLVYTYAVKNPRTLNKYKGFSELTYGETSYELMFEILNMLELKEDDIFVDLGCGIGQLVLQVAAYSGCKMCYGIEKAKIPAGYMKSMDKYFKLLMQWFGKVHGQYELFEGDFLDKQFQDIIESCTTIFSNNLIFGSKLNCKLAARLATLKNGTRIISSSCFTSLKKRRITERSLNDISSAILLHKSVDGFVSWTYNKVTYYIQTIDHNQLNKENIQPIRKRKRLKKSNGNAESHSKSPKQNDHLSPQQATTQISANISSHTPSEATTGTLQQHSLESTELQHSFNVDSEKPQFQSCHLPSNSVHRRQRQRREPSPDITEFRSSNSRGKHNDSSHTPSEATIVTLQQPSLETTESQHSFNVNSEKPQFQSCHLPSDSVHRQRLDPLPDIIDFRSSNSRGKHNDSSHTPSESEAIPVTLQQPSLETTESQHSFNVNSEKPQFQSCHLPSDSVHRRRRQRRDPSPDITDFRSSKSRGKHNDSIHTPSEATPVTLQQHSLETTELPHSEKPQFQSCHLPSDSVHRRRRRRDPSPDITDFRSSNSRGKHNN